MRELSAALERSVGYLMGEESSPDQGAASQQKEAAYNDREPDSLEQALLAAANELSPLQKADLIAYARQLSGAQPQPSRPDQAVRDYLDEPLTASADEPERRRQDEGPPAGVERRAKP